MKKHNKNYIDFMEMLKEGSNVEMVRQLNLMKDNYFLSLGPKPWQNTTNGRWIVKIPDASRPEGNRQVSSYDKAKVENVIIAYVKSKIEEQRSASPTLRELFGIWISNKTEIINGTSEISPATRDKYCADFERFCSEISDVRLVDFTAKEIREYVNKKSHGIDIKAVGAMKSLIARLFEYAESEGMTKEVISVTVRNYKPPKTILKKKVEKVEVFSDDVCRQIFDYLVKHSDNAKCVCLLICMFTGLRIGEATTLTFDDVRNGNIFVERSQSRHKENGRYVYAITDPKTEKSRRVVPIPEEVEEMLVDMVNNLDNGKSKWVFPDKFGKPYTPNNMNNRIKRMLNALHLDPAGTHAFRKTLATMYEENGMTPAELCQLLGHSTIETTYRYYIKTRKNPEKLKKAAAGKISFLKAV